MSDHDQSRRDFLKKAAYTAPVVLTLAAAPSFATHGSSRGHGGGHKHGHGRRRGQRR